MNDPRFKTLAPGTPIVAKEDYKMGKETKITKGKVYVFKGYSGRNGVQIEEDDQGYSSSWGDGVLGGKDGTQYFDLLSDLMVPGARYFPKNDQREFTVVPQASQTYQGFTGPKWVHGVRSDHSKRKRQGGCDVIHQLDEIGSVVCPGAVDPSLVIPGDRFLAGNCEKVFVAVNGSGNPDFKTGPKRICAVKEILFKFHDGDLGIKPTHIFLQTDAEVNLGPKDLDPDKEEAIVVLSGLADSLSSLGVGGKAEWLRSYVDSLKES